MGAGTHHTQAETARTLITETPDRNGNDYRLWAELVPCAQPKDTVELRFSSTWAGAKNPQESQVRGRYLLDATAIDNLRRLLGAR